MKKIRVAWDDLKPGDLIHVKGSTNVYKFKSRTEWPDYIAVDTDECGAHPCMTFRLGMNIDDLKLVVLKNDFAYATRPAPKKKPRPNIVEPKMPGEYWARLRVGSKTIWGQIIKRYTPRADSWLAEDEAKKPYQTSWYGSMAGLHPWMTWGELLEVNRSTPILELLTAEEYYTRKAKGEL